MVWEALIYAIHLISATHQKKGRWIAPVKQIQPLQDFIIYYINNYNYNCN